MAKTIKCSDVGVDCDWSASASTEEELMKKVKCMQKNMDSTIYRRNFLQK